MPTIISWFWLAFIVFWFVSALRAKRSVKGSHRPWLVTRLVMIVVIVTLFSIPRLRPLFIYQLHNPFFLWIGTVGTFFGIALALWARVFIGRNWGMPMTQREEPQLITTGPYRYVRHPIYSGVLLALLGSGFVTPIWWLFFVLFSGYFIYALHVEEKYMATVFPDTYPQYKRNTRRLIPGIF
ncbi:MAG TPA: isoprenylcysteine carboxylmethyltransferase family protein [Candidatus Paceibacterota bacterium]|nr:isoprenylcysteine carboxylmethyltransferase family protein [Candidatus Paceibacterota bacterium]